MKEGISFLMMFEMDSIFLIYEKSGESLCL